VQLSRQLRMCSVRSLLHPVTEIAHDPARPTTTLTLVVPLPPKLGVAMR
jgi:hypothetical protein